MRHVLVVGIALGSLAACKSRRDAPPTATPPGPGTLDAAAPAPPGPDAAALDPSLPPPDEDSVRAGKRTGLGTADERPEVATEALAQALLTGQLPWRRFVDPSLGLVELRTAPDLGGLPMTRRCGPDLDAALTRITAEATALLTAPASAHELACDNTGLLDPTGPSALCSIDAPAEDATGLDLVFVPDARLGLRLVGVTTVIGGPAADTILDAFDLELARTGTLCR